MMLSKIKKIIENNPVALATVMKNEKPNAVVLAFAKVVSDKEILLTDNYLRQTIRDLQKNKNVCLLVWDKKWQGYKIIGRAEYFTSGKWKKFVEQMKENNDLPAKGAILIKASKIIKAG
jgi:predicted pyridoxine 5'-phosphate oxidase superfamily flavin-nucleotide-binding protein